MKGLLEEAIERYVAECMAECRANGYIAKLEAVADAARVLYDEGRAMPCEWPDEWWPPHWEILGATLKELDREE